MSLTEDPPAARRRHGAELEAALLDAAWDELAERGYDAFTIDAVATRAHTSRAVLYRRWQSKQELVSAAIGSRGFQQTTEIPDTGSLRGDLLEFLKNASRSRTQKGLVLITRLGAFYSETGTNLAQLRAGFLQGRTEALDVMLQRSVDRGEVDPAKLTPRVKRVAFDLFLHELTMTLEPVPDTSIHEIVDEVFLPLVRMS